MSEQDAQPESGSGDGEVKSAAPSDERQVVGENADVPAGEGEEADEAGVEGGASRPDASSEKDEKTDDDRDALAREIESDPSSNPEDPLLREIKGG